MVATITFISSIIAAAAAVLATYFGWRLYKLAHANIIVKAHAEINTERHDEVDIHIICANTGGRDTYIDPKKSRIDVRSPNQKPEHISLLLNFEHRELGVSNKLEANGGKIETILSFPLLGLQIGRLFVVEINSGKEWNISNSDRMNFNEQIKKLQNQL